MNIHPANQRRIAYECELLRTTPEKLYYLMPWLFCEDNVTAANTNAIEDKKPEAPRKEIPEQVTEKEYDMYYGNMDDEYYSVD